MAKTSASAKHIGYRCFFCGGTIATAGCDPCALELTMGFGKAGSRETNVTFFVHLRCLLANADSSMQEGLADVAELAD